MAALVSILVPAFNAERTIAETLTSALSQTCPRKEIIVVDDGSTDETLRIARRFQSKELKVISQSNSGASSARNAALDHAQGEFIQWLDADDLLALDKISQQLSQTEMDGSSRILLSSSFGAFYIQTSRAVFKPNLLWRDMTPVDFLQSMFTENVWMSSSCWLVSRRLTELAGPWDERLSLDDDGEYFSRVVCASDKIKFVKEARSFYRLHNPGSLSRGVSDAACRSQFLSLSLRIGQLRALEDSVRVRTAGIQLLNSCLFFFYPEHEELLSQAQNLAKDLGGKLTAPRLGWKYEVLSRLFGWKIAKRVKRTVVGIKLRVRLACERLLRALSDIKFSVE